MQTFLPYSDFKKTASVLDRQRLGKQRVETMQIMQCFVKPTRWKNHPAVKMWKNYPWALLVYQTCIVTEWTDTRGYRDTCLIKTIDTFSKLENTNIGVYPDWLGNYDFHLSHQSNLLRKKPEHYSQYFNVPVNLNYIWPK